MTFLGDYLNLLQKQYEAMPAKLKYDIYAFGVFMSQMVSRILFPPNQYRDEGVYKIDRVPGVPGWYEQLYMAHMVRDHIKRPTLEI
jgi:hypothetical protein